VERRNRELILPARRAMSQRVAVCLWTHPADLMPPVGDDGFERSKRAARFIRSRIV
jgi:hypothetical protein